MPKPTRCGTRQKTRSEAGVMPEGDRMPLAPLVEANGAAIPAIGLGTWQLSGDECIRAIQTALEAGYRHVDTASMYANEEAVGAGIRAGRVPREDIFVTTKVWHDD